MSNVTDIRTGLPVVAGVEIAVDEHGRFNLNAIHAASGTGKSKQPNEWLRTKQARDLAAELEPEIPGIKILETVKGRGKTGTFAHELLAISYAGWISPAFQLKVNQVFMDYRTGNLSPIKVPGSLAEALRLAADQAERIEHQAQKIRYLENFFQEGVTLTAFGKMLNGVNCMQMAGFVASELNWLYDESRSGNSPRWRVRCTARDKYLTEVPDEIKTHGNEGFIRHKVQLLSAGAQKLYSLYLDGKLPMKKTWDGEFTHVKFQMEAA